MDNPLQDSETSSWFSTYGLLTAERILEYFKIRLSHDELIATIKDAHSFHHQLLRVPLKNVLNGIILQQAQDYQVYAQQLFIDYVLAGQSQLDLERPGAETREDLEAERQKLMESGETFNQYENKHHKLVAETQTQLMHLAQEWKADSDPKSIDNALAPFLERSESLNVQLRNYRNQFYQHILATKELLRLLPNYYPDEAQDAQNRSAIDFDQHIGDV
jgi:hypothetical protein